MTLALTTVFADLPDPRRETKNKLHRLTDILVIATCAVLARGRRTVTSWVRAAGLSNEYRTCYTTGAAAGK